jgi:hypothetical protein
VLVATAAGIWSDRRVTNSSGSVFTPVRKAVRGSGLVAGFCGDLSACRKAIRAVRDGESNVQAIAAICDGLLVNSKGVWELSEKFATRVRSSIPFATQGSGYAEAHSFLTGRGSWLDVDVRSALRHVAKVRSDCGDGIDHAAL